jgi:hypothetical protein
VFALTLHWHFHLSKVPGQVAVCNCLVRAAHVDQNALPGEATSCQGGCGGIPTDPRTGAWEVSDSTQVSGRDYSGVGTELYISSTN